MLLIDPFDNQRPSMGERRNRKPYWDSEDETKHMSGMREHNSWAGKAHHSSHGSGRYHNSSDSRTTSRRDSRDHSGWPSWESIEEEPAASMNRSFNNTYEGKEMGGGKIYHESMSPGFEEMELHNYNHTREYDRSHSQRYMRKVRSRSRSKTRGRTRSRSLSRGRERERGRGWNRSRSRSRSRNDGYGYANANRRSSPIGDYRHHSNGWSDKRNGQETSSETCRDFSVGRCRKSSSQCEFFHPSRRDNDLVEDGRVDSWRSRSNHSQTSRHSYTRQESRNDVSDQYRGEDSRSRTNITCRDFKIGNCRWGDGCRFSHDAASTDSQDTRNATFNGKAICKFFAAGRCNRDNCRFAHDGPDLNSQEVRLDKVDESHSSHDKSDWRNAPKWDDATRVSDAPVPIGWGEAFATNTTATGDITNGESDDRWGFKSKNENEINGMQERTSSYLDSERRPSLPGESGIYDGVDIAAAKQGHLILHGLQLQNKDEIANSDGLSALQANQKLTVEALQQNVPSAPHTEPQHFGVIKSNPMSSFGSNLLSGQYFNHNGTSMLPLHSSVPNENDLGQNMLYTNLSNGHDSDLKQSETHTINSSNVQMHGQSDHTPVESMVSSETKFPKMVINLLPSRHPDQVSNSSVTNAVSLTQSLLNERSQTCAGVDISDFRGALPSLSCITDCPPLVETSSAQDNVHTVPLDQFNSIGNSREENTDPNLAQAIDQSNQMPLNRSPPTSIVGTEVESSKPKHPEIPRQQAEMVANVGAMAEESKVVEDKNRPSENVDGQEKREEGSAIKDEKGMRLFKNALVELVKEILKPTWKEGRMSRDVHKSVVKKVVDKVSSTIQADHIPKTQDKIEQYLSSSKPKITKLVEAYVERSRKAEA